MKIFINLKNRALEDKLKMALNELNEFKRKFTEEIKTKNQTISDLERRLGDLNEKFDRLFDIKISLERELEVYRSLLDSHRSSN